MSITTYSLQGFEIGFVPIPGKFVAILKEHNIIWYQMPVIRGRSVIDIPEGFEPLGSTVASGLSEEEAGRVVERDGDRWEDYSYRPHRDSMRTAKESLLSLIERLSLDPETHVVIFKNK